MSRGDGNGGSGEKDSGGRGAENRTVIIGGVAGGATTAARLRRRDEEREIILLERGEYISYANCGLPYYVGGVIENRKALLLQDPKVMRERFRIDVRTQSEATAIHPERRTVEVRDQQSGEIYEESYGDLVIATGSSPLVPPIPGIDRPNIFTLWTVPDTDAIRSFVEQRKPRRAAVIGGGFIGLEMAENLHRLGLQVSIIEQQDQVMAPLDYEMAKLLHENLEMNGVSLILGDGVASFSDAASPAPSSGTASGEDGAEGRGGERPVRIALSSGREVEADLVILSIGVRPNSGLAREAGLKLNARGGIVVDRCLRTSDEHIYAVGDVIQVENFVSGEPAMIPLAGPANKQARICADNIAGDRKEYRGTMGTSVARVFDYAAAVTGLNEKTLGAMGRKKGEDYFAILINQKSHAGYYPGAAPLLLKLIFGREGEILGGQIVGQDGVDKRIDTIASVMREKGTICDLEELELAYAPPFSSAKDPVNMLGFTAENVLNGLVDFITWDELDALSADPGEAAELTILDVSEPVERSVYQIPGSVNIPLGELRQRRFELDPKKQIAVYCAIGVRSYNAARLLAQSGFERVKVLAGGVSFYKSMHYEEFKQQPGERQPGEREAQSGPNPGQKDLRENGAISAAAEPAKAGQIKIVDCCGLQCPGPIMKVHESILGMEEGDVLEVSATDMGFARDIASWCRRTGNTLVDTERKDGKNVVRIQKGEAAPARREERTSAGSESEKNGKTIVVFSGDLDKVLAAFIIANGAAAMGRPVTMFFTFWGLNALRKPKKLPVKKSAVERMFGAMMPRGSGKLKLSRMNMGGAGTRMMRSVMRAKHVDSLESLMEQAMKNGVKLVACTMSMDVMGIRREELIDGVELAGAASYLGDAECSDVNLFVS